MDNNIDTNLRRISIFLNNGNGSTMHMVCQTIVDKPKGKKLCWFCSLQCSDNCVNDKMGCSFYCCHCMGKGKVDSAHREREYKYEYKFLLI